MKLMRFLDSGMLGQGTLQANRNRNRNPFLGQQNLLFGQVRDMVHTIDLQQLLPVQSEAKMSCDDSPNVACTFIGAASGTFRTERCRRVGDASEQAYQYD